MRTDQAYTGSGDVLVLAVSLELAAAKWKVALHDGRRENPAVHTVAQPQAAARLQAVLDLIEAYRGKWSLPADVRIAVLAHLPGSRLKNLNDEISTVGKRALSKSFNHKWLI